MPHKIFIIYYSWANTADNHAGMAYLAKQIRKTYPEEVRLIKVPSKWNSWIPRVRKFWHLLLIVYFRLVLRKNDSILFVEFLGNRSGDQAGLALKLRKHGIQNKFIGLVHLSPANLKELFGDDSHISQRLDVLDKILVFGTSLEKYFIDLGFETKVRRTFHYVDSAYYYPSKNKHNNQRLNILSLGSLKRNRELLKEIAIECRFADFKICMGRDNFSELFEGIENVTLFGFIPENELLDLMRQSDVSLSVLNDTVGSNVIVTSLATGLVNVVSDVGSIRDYCSEDNSFLCSSGADFVGALKKLDSDRNLLNMLSKRSVERALDFALVRFIKIFPDLLA